MNVLTVIFGGLDHEYLDRWPCPNLRQAEWGPVVVDRLHDDRDVASQITAQFITGRTWRDNGVRDRKKELLTFRNELVRRLESSPIGSIDKGRIKRQRIYQALGWLDIVSREYLHCDLTCPSLFDVIPNSRAVYVPAWNPEPSWAMGRNILDPQRYPDLGVAGALDLREKNFQWRRRAFLEALTEPAHRLLVGQFQYIDSTQHLYLTYHSPAQIDEIEKAYWRMDGFAAEILAAARDRYDRVLFVSDNGAALEQGGIKPTHHNRPFYSSSDPLGLDRPNLRDFFDLIVAWTNAEVSVA